MTETNLGHKGSEGGAELGGCLQWVLRCTISGPPRQGVAGTLQLASWLRTPASPYPFHPLCTWFGSSEVTLRKGVCHEDAVSCWFVCF